MAVRPYSTYDDVTGVHANGEPHASGRRGGPELSVIWLFWGLAAAFWAAALTTLVGIMTAIGHPAANGPGAGEADAGGVGWLLIDVVGGILVLGVAIAYGTLRNVGRDRRLDPVTEAATRREYDLVEAAGGDDDVRLSPKAERRAGADVLHAGDPSTDLPTTQGRA